MKRARKSNRVSWATGGNLCQVKLFLSEDCPSKVGRKSQHHLQVKSSTMLQSSTNEPDDLPPGFENNHFLNQSKVELSCISQLKWECPPPFVVSPRWQVAAGEKSSEKEDQKLREMRVLEAVYPRLSAIPPNPSVSLDVEEEDYDDNNTPLIPVISIEEEESMDILPEFSIAVNPSPSVQLQNSQQYKSATTSISSASNPCHTSSMDTCGSSFEVSSELDEVDLAAVSSVVATILRSNLKERHLIDMDLLVKIFNDPKAFEELMNKHRTAVTTVSASSNTMDVSSSVVKPTTPSVPLSASDVTRSGTTQSTMGLLLPSGLKPANPSVSLLNPTLDKPATLPVPAIPSVSLMSSTHDKPVTTSVPLSGPVSGKPVTQSVSLLTHTPHVHRSVGQNFHHVSCGMSPALNTKFQLDTALASGPKRSAPVSSISFSESNSGPLPSPLPTTAGNLPASTMTYKPNTGSAFAVKDANYYKNLIRQHGADKYDMQDSHIGIPHSNFQDMKLVHNIKQGEVKHKIQKPCIYFKSSKGCRNGSNCPYQHDVSAQWGAGNVVGAQNAKRMKLGSETYGRTKS